MNTYKPKSSFTTTESGTVYNLRPTDSRDEEWENDVRISIHAPHLTPEQRDDLSETIAAALNEKYLHNAES